MALENEDFNALWEAVGWPLNITKQVRHVKAASSVPKQFCSD